MAEIRLLDCTLRDGGHINQGRFGKNVIKSIIADLVKSKIDIIEAGFLWKDSTDNDTARFHSIAELKEYLPKEMGGTKISLMADSVELDELEPYDGTVEYIRLSFRRDEFDWAERNAKTLIEKGYKVYINPIHGSAFSDEEYLRIIERVNKLHLYGFSIVDTFGAMRQSDLGRIYYLVEHNLDSDITLGVHLHENLGLAYSLAQYIMQIISPKRDITIDGSLFGMGKIPGNLCIEQVMDFLNIEYQKDYSVEPIYDAIDDFIMPIYEQIQWGYSIPYALSAQCSVHRTYAEYLTNKERLRTKDIKRLLSQINSENAEIFNEEYIETIYQSYMGTSYNDRHSLDRIIKRINNFEKIIIVAPGSSINDFDFSKVVDERTCVIAVNFVPSVVHANMYFFTNAKRFGLITDVEKSDLLITSNLIEDCPEAENVFSRNELVYHNDVFSDDSTLMMINLLKRIGVKEILIAGFDGFKKDGSNFSDVMYERKVRKDDYDLPSRISILKNAYSDIQIRFLTPSLYDVLDK